MTGNRQRYTTSRFSSSGELLFNSLLDNSLHALSSVFVPFHFASPFFSILSFFSSFLSSLPCLSFSLSSPPPEPAAAHSFRYFLSSRKRARKDESDMLPLFLPLPSSILAFFPPFELLHSSFLHTAPFQRFRILES